MEQNIFFCTSKIWKLLPDNLKNSEKKPGPPAGVCLSSKKSLHDLGFIWNDLIHKNRDLIRIDIF